VQSVYCAFLTGFVGFLISLYGGIYGSFAIPLSCVLVGCLSLGLTRIYRADSVNPLTSGTVIYLASVFGLATGTYLSEQNENTLLATLSFPLLGVALGIGTRIRNFRASVECSLCRNTYEEQYCTTCPRCRLSVCTVRCWLRQRRRCVVCEKYHRKILPESETWWKINVGAVANTERCECCRTMRSEAGACHPCPHCASVYCRFCWDDCYGECPNPECDWTISAIPAGVRRQGRR